MQVLLAKSPLTCTVAAFFTCEMTPLLQTHPDTAIADMLNLPAQFVSRARLQVAAAAAASLSLHHRTLLGRCDLSHNGKTRAVVQVMRYDYWNPVSTSQRARDIFRANVTNRVFAAAGSRHYRVHHRNYDAGRSKQLRESQNGRSPLFHSLIFCPGLRRCWIL